MKPFHPVFVAVLNLESEGDAWIAGIDRGAERAAVFCAGDDSTCNGSLVSAVVDDREALGKVTSWWVDGGLDASGPVISSSW